MPEQQPGPFQPSVSEYQGTPGTGANWTYHAAQASLTRIRNSQSVEEAQAQAATEAVVLLHSIRRILIWTLVIVPVLLVAVGVVLIVMTPGSGSTSLY